MAAGDFYDDFEEDLANSGDFLIDPADAATGAIEVHTIVAGGAADVFFEVDPDGDGTFEISENIFSVVAGDFLQQNKIELKAASNMRLRINNTSGGPADFVATGVEVES